MTLEEHNSTHTLLTSQLKNLSVCLIFLNILYYNVFLQRCYISIDTGHFNYLKLLKRPLLQSSYLQFFNCTFLTKGFNIYLRIVMSFIFRMILEGFQDSKRKEEKKRRPSPAKLVFLLLIFIISLFLP